MINKLFLLVLLNLIFCFTNGLTIWNNSDHILIVMIFRKKFFSFKEWTTSQVSARMLNSEIWGNRVSKEVIPDIDKNLLIRFIINGRQEDYAYRKYKDCKFVVSNEKTYISKIN